MYFVSIILIAFADFCLGNVAFEKISARGVGDSGCLGVTGAGIRCISRTEFVMAFQDPKNDPPIKCPDGMVCADVPNICSNTSEPLCSNEVVGSSGVCNRCPPSRLYNPVCVSDIHYGFCIKGSIQSKLTYQCKPPNIYCKATFDSARPPRLISICSPDSANLDCPIGTAEKINIPTTTSKPSPRNFILGLVDSLIKASKQAQINADVIPMTNNTYAFDEPFYT